MTTYQYQAFQIKCTFIISLILVYSSALGIANKVVTNDLSGLKTGQFSSRFVSDNAIDLFQSKDQRFESATNITTEKLQNKKTNIPSHSFSAELSAFQLQTYPFFPKIFVGNGIDHMNINLVNLNQTGLLVGDEIGVFDGIYCVGSALIEDKNITGNNISIPASANDTIASQPNGYIDGHKITLKLYRSGTVYQLYFQTVNNSQDIFVRGGSMFALINFSQSTGQFRANQAETIKMYPNPFDNRLTIELNFPNEQQLKVQIFNQMGALVLTLYDGKIFGSLILNWDGKDSNQNLVSSGTYYCKVNENMFKIIFKPNK